MWGFYTNAYDPTPSKNLADEQKKAGCSLCQFANQFQLGKDDSCQNEKGYDPSFIRSRCKNYEARMP